MTWSRRYFCTSLCGSSWAFTMGRFRVVSSPDHLLEELGPLGQLERDLPIGHPRCLRTYLAGAGEELAGDEEGQDAGYHPSEAMVRSMR